MRIHPRRRKWPTLAAACLAAGGCAMSGNENTPDQNRSTALESVTGTTWEWTGTRTPNREIAVTTPKHYTVRFKDNGEAQIRFDCNHGGGLYDMAEGRLAFGPLTYTRIKCGEGSQSISYRHQLGAVESFFTERGELYLELPNDAGTMRFRRAGEGG